MRRYRYSHSEEYSDFDGPQEMTHYFEDVKADTEVRIQTTDGKITESIRVWYPSTNWNNFEPLGYMMKDVHKVLKRSKVRAR